MKTVRLLYIGNGANLHDVAWAAHFGQNPRFEVFFLSTTRLAAIPLETKAAFHGTWLEFPALPSSLSWRLPLMWLHLTNIVRKRQIDLVHLFYLDEKLLLVLARIIVRCPFVLTSRGSDALVDLPELFKAKRLRARITSGLMRVCWRLVDFVTFTSDSQWQSLVRLLGEGPRAYRVRTGVSCSVSGGWDSPLPAFQGGPFILFPRLMRPVYNHEFALDVIESLSPEVLNQYTMLFVDKDSPDEGYVAKICKRMQRSGAKFLWLPLVERERMRGLYQQAALTIITARSDGSPVSAMEAMLCRCPLILPPLPYDADLFGRGVARPGTWEPRAWAACIERCLLGTDPQIDLEEARCAVLAFGNREVEMGRLETYYERARERTGAKAVRSKTRIGTTVGDGL